MQGALTMDRAGRARQRWVLGVTAVASLLVTLDALVVSTALSTIRTELHASAQQLEWTVNAYTLSFAVLLMTGAILGDRFGRRAVFCIGVGLFAAASAGCAMAPDIGWLIAARAVQGGAAAMVVPLGLAMLTAAFAPRDRPKALGIFGGVSGLGVSLGPLLGGAVVQGISWPWIFWLNVPVGLALIALTRLRIAESFGQRSDPDPVGLVLVTGAALGIVWALVRGAPAGWGSSEVLATLAAGIVMAVAFVGWESRAATPMLPLRLFTSRRFSAGNAAIFFQWGSALGAIYLMSQFLQNGLGYGPLSAGLRMSPWGAVTVIVPQVAGRLIGRVGERPLIVTGMTLNAAALGTIALIAGPHVSYWQIGLLLAISGAGLATSLPAVQSAALTSVQPADIGIASGTLMTVRQLGGAFGVAILVAVFSSTGSYAAPHRFIEGFTPALGVCAALAACAALAGLSLPGRQRPPAAGLSAITPIPKARLTPENADEPAQATVRHA
jgi:EmrB/QacA subfamily drug resistance transporter